MKKLISLGLAFLFVMGIAVAAVKVALTVFDMPAGWETFDGIIWNVAEPLSDRETFAFALGALAFGCALLAAGVVIAFLKIHRNRSEEGKRTAAIFEALAAADPAQAALLRLLLEQGQGGKAEGGLPKGSIVGGMLFAAVFAIGGGVALLLHHEAVQKHPLRVVHNDPLVAPKSTGQGAQASAPKRRPGGRDSVSEGQGVAGVRDFGGSPSVEGKGSSDSCVCPAPPVTPSGSGDSDTWESEETWEPEETQPEEAWESREEWEPEEWEPEETWEVEEEWEPEEAWETEEAWNRNQEEGGW